MAMSSDTYDALTMQAVAACVAYAKCMKEIGIPVKEQDSSAFAADVVVALFVEPMRDVLVKALDSSAREKLDRETFLRVMPHEGGHQ